MEPYLYYSFLIECTDAPTVDPKKPSVVLRQPDVAGGWSQKVSITFMQRYA